jgi:hypothetical protein
VSIFVHPSQKGGQKALTAPILENTSGNALNAFTTLRGLFKKQNEVVRVTSLEGGIR